MLERVEKELNRAKELFPLWPTDPLHAASIVAEEMGELTKAILEVTYEPHKSTVKDVEEEAVQAAAMALRFLENLKQYKFERNEWK